MKNLFMIMLVAISFSVSVFGQSTVKSSVYSLSKNTDKVLFSLPYGSTTEVILTKSSRMTVEQKISYSGNLKNQLIKYLKENGRYDFQKQIDEPMRRTFFAHQLRNYLVNKGKKISEEIHYKIYLPENKEIIFLTDRKTNYFNRN